MTSLSSALDNWPHFWYGFWRSDASETNLPRIEDVAHADWPSIEEEKIVAYLEGTPVVVTAFGPLEKCLLCDELIGSSTYRSDGTWLWPDDLSHYVKQHNVALPPLLMQHIRDQQFSPPSECTVAIEELPWP